MVASVQSISTDQNASSSDVLTNSDQELEVQELSYAQTEDTTTNTDVQEENPVSAIPYDLEDAPLSDTEKNEAQAESEKTEPNTESNLDAPPKAEIQTPEETPEALPVEAPPINTDNAAALINSLDGLPATSFIAGMGTVSNAANEVQANEQTALSESMPEIEQPTGLPTKGSSELAEFKPKNQKAPELKPKEGEKEQTVEVEHQTDLAPIPQQNTPKIKAPEVQAEEEESESWW
ncbi:MAG: hypothetical protein AAFO82_20975, partial [Bacteroidota bacterium]